MLVRFTISSAKTTGTSTDLSVLQPGQYPQTATIPKSMHDSLSQVLLNTGDSRVPDRFSDWFRVTTVGLNSDEINELEVFEGFLGRHVQPNRNHDVQCILL